MGPQTFLMLWLMGETGCRIGEVLGLRVYNMHLSDPDDPYIHVEFSLGRKRELNPPKARSGRTVPISRELAAALKPHMDGRRKDEAAFRGPRADGALGWRYHSWWMCRWRVVLELAEKEFGLDLDLKLHPHALRHNNITWARDALADPRDVRRHVGHRNAHTTEGYELDGPAVRTRMREVISMFGPPPGQSQIS